jgi:Ribbon-helix-helix protein, copG family
VVVTSIALTDEQLARLRHHAQASGQSLDEVVREAVDTYLAHLREAATSPDAAPPSGPAEDGWQPIVRTAVDGARVPIPPAMSPDEVEALLAQPSARARGDFLRAWLLKRGGGIIHEPPPGPPDPAWQARFDDALAQIRARVPPDMTPEEIEALITEASEEARQERIAKRAQRERRPLDPEEQADIDAALIRIREKLPLDLSPEEIDAAWQEVRQERRAAWIA